VDHDHVGARVREQHGQPVGGVGRVERHVGAAGLQDAQHALDHGGAALDAQPHAVAAAHAQRAQVTRQALRAGEQLGVRDPLVGADDGRRVRGGGRLGGDEVVQALAGRVVPRGRVPHAQHALALGRRQRVDVAQRRAAPRRTVGQAHDVVQQPAHRGRGEAPVS
jgi:hypothetical protein